jgi:hypothetical protein
MRWAALSRLNDTVDTVDSVKSGPAETRPNPHSVSQCQSVDRQNEPAETRRNPSVSSSPVHIVNTVNSVTHKERGDGKTVPTVSTTILTLYDTVEVPPSTAPAVSYDTVDNVAEQAAIIEEGAGVPRRWAEGFAALGHMQPPGFSAPRWRRVIDTAGRFLDRWAAMAIASGWSDLDVFGAHPDAPAARFDAMGLVLLLDRCEVVAIDSDGADLLTNTGARQRYRRRTMSDTVPLWELRS